MVTQRIQQFYELNAEQAIDEVGQINAALRQHGATLKDVISIQRQANAENQTAITTFKAINKAGQQVAVTLKQSNKEVEGETVQVKDLSVKVSDLDSRVKNLIASLNAYRGEHTKVDKAQVRAILQLESYEKQVRSLAAYLSQLRKEELKQAAAANQVASSRKQVAATFITDYESRAGTRKGPLSGTDIIAINQATQRLYDSISKTTIQYSQLFDLQSKLNAGQFVKIDPQYAEIASALANLNHLYKNLGFSGAQAFQTISHSAEKESKKTILAWTNFARFFATHLAYTAFFQTIQAMRAAAQEAFELQKRISEIRTITQDNQRSQEEYFESIAKISATTGAAFQDVAEGLYETISNQIATGERATDFLVKAGEFARVTNSTVEDSINLLSSALNSYNLTAEDAGEVSAKLFRLIDLGRVRASEIADTFGRVAVLASQMGISLEEASASIAILTINGVRYSESYTQIINLMQAFLRPTAKMTEYINSLGFETGEQLVKIKGWTGVLALLREELEKGGVQRIAELDDNIRGLRGAIGLIGSSVESGEFARVVDEITNSLDSYKQAVDSIAFESPAARLEIEWRKLQGTMLKFGPTILKGTSLLVSQINGMLSVVEKGNLALSTIKYSLLGPLALPVLGLEGASESDALNNEQSRRDSTIKARIEQGEAYRKSVNSLVSTIVKRFEELKKAKAEELAEKLRGLNTTLKETQTRSDSIKSAFDRMFDIATEKAEFFKKLLETINKVQQQIDQREFDSGIEKLEPRQQRTQLREGVEQALATGRGALGEQNLDKAEEEFATATRIFQSLSDKQVDAALEYNAAKLKYVEAQQKFDSDIAEIESQLRADGNDIDYASLRQQQATLQAQREAELSRLSANLDVSKLKLFDLVGYSGRSLEDATQIINTETELTREQVLKLLRLDASQTELEKAIQEIRRRAAGQVPLTQTISGVEFDVGRTAGITPERLADLEALTQLSKFKLADFVIKDGDKELFDVEKLTKELDVISGKLAEPIPGDPFAEITTAAQELINTYRTLATVQNQVSTGVGLQAIVSELDSTLTNIQNLNNRVTTGASEFQANRAYLQEMLSRIAAEGGADIAAPIKGFQDILTTLSGSTAEEISKNQYELASQVSQYRLALAAGLDAAEAAKVFTGDTAKSFDDFTTALVNTLSNEIGRQQNLIQLRDELLRLSGDIQKATGQGLTPTEEAGVSALTTTPVDSAVSNAVAQIKALTGETGAAFSSVNQDLINFDAKVTATTQLLQVNIPTAAGEASRAISALTTAASANMANAQIAVASLAAEIAKLPVEKTITIKIRKIESGSGVPLAAGGLASGSSSLGTDFVPALLSPGEFVVNAQASRLFFSELQAINAASRRVPALAGGGAITTGDININLPNVNGSKITTSNAREIADAIKRELRKGTVGL